MSCIPYGVEDLVIYDYKGNYKTTVRLEHKSGAYYVESDKFFSRLKKEKLGAMRLSSFTNRGYVVRKLEQMGNIREALEACGVEFRKDGFMK